jgi:uncharacterized protein (DUF736 family)
MQIGTFKKIGPIFRGRLQSLMLDLPLVLVAEQRGMTSRTPDWRVHIEDDDTGEHYGPAIGAGWVREGKKSGPYIALQFDCPTLPQPLRANLMPSERNDGEHLLFWSPRRRQKSVEQPDAAG